MAQPVVHPAPNHLEWTQVHMCLDGYGRAIKGIPADKRASYLRMLANEAKDKSLALDADGYMGMAWIAQLIASEEDPDLPRKLADPRLKAFIARQQRTGSTLGDAFAKLCEVMSMDLFQLQLGDDDKQVVSQMLRDISNQTWGDNYPSHLKHYTERAMDTSASSEERRRANLCMSLLLAMDTSPMGNNDARKLLSKMVDNRDLADSDEDSSPEDSDRFFPSKAPATRLNLNVGQFSDVAFGRALLEAVTFAAGLRMRPRKRRQVPPSASPRGQRRVGEGIPECRNQ